MKRKYLRSTDNCDWCFWLPNAFDERKACLQCDSLECVIVGATWSNVHKQIDMEETNMLSRLADMYRLKHS